MTAGERSPFDLPYCRDSGAPANGKGHQRLPTRQIHFQAQEERKVNLRLAAFCLAVAAVLILATVLARAGQPPDLAPDRNPFGGVVLEAHPNPDGRTHQGLVVLFGLCNMGRQAICIPFTPARICRSVQVLVRKQSSSEWIKPSGASEAASRETESIRRWIEMPPGGCIDGEFDDQVEVPGDHVYEVSLKPDQEIAPMRIVSGPYHSTSTQRH